jgi:hypothetical protein
VRRRTSRAVFVLRHNHYHLGILDGELWRRGMARPEWR